MIFFDFLQSDWLQQRAAFYDILTVVQKPRSEDNFEKPRSEDNFQTQSTTQKVLKSTLSILKTVKYSELALVDLVPSPKCTFSRAFLRPKCEKNNINIEKILASATCLDSNAPLYSAILRKYMYKYK